jgi:hypothetical protein
MFGGSKESAPAPAAQAAAPAAPLYDSSASSGGACSYDQRAFTDCLKQNPNNASVCDQYFSALQACQSRM